MPHPKIHEKIDKIIFGRSFPEIHKWIDGTFDGTNGRTHWINRHHKEAIDNQYTRFYRQIAYLHVMVDWLWYHRIICVPKNAEEVKEMLQKFGVFVNERPR